MPPGTDEQLAERLLLVSNRGPVQFRLGEQGSLVARRGGGGLVTALGGLATHHDVTWIAHAMGEGDVAAARQASGRPFDEISRTGDAYRLQLVGTPDAQYELAYSTLSNPLLWFVQHRLYGFGTAPTVDRHTHIAMRGYRTVNQRLADATVKCLARDAEAARDAPIVMVHDYHLFCVPGLVRASAPDAFIHFFLHVPWPDPGAWRCVPRAWIEEFLASLSACDLIGVQTRRDAVALLQTARHFTDAVVDFDAGTITLDDRVAHVRPFPISVAIDEFVEHSRSATVQRLRERIRGMRPAGGDGAMIVRVDRTDPSKNIVRGFQAFGLLLHEHPEWHGRVSMFCQLDPSRQDIEEYSAYMRQIQAAADEVNVQFGTGSWQPLFLNIDSNFLAAVAAYGEYDVLYVNPVADGMNLVSKEGPLVNDRNGSIVLSEQAGSFNELGPWVHAVNPFDIAQQADALHEALMAPLEQRAARAEAIREHVRAHDVDLWITEQLRCIRSLRASGAAPAALEHSGVRS